MHGEGQLQERCGACGGVVDRRIVSWAGRCRSCGSWRSQLQPEIASEDLHRKINAAARVSGLKTLRDANNARILDAIGEYVPMHGAALLDVGSAHGWFLRAASARGAHAEGVEPEARLADASRDEGCTVRAGYFPDVIQADERFDAITFNDVLEHIPDARAAVAASARLLRPGGVLSVNIPSADGLGYRVALGLARLRVRQPFKRFWQFGLPSPHVHYFVPKALTEMIEQHGLIVRRVVPLSAIDRSGLWARVHSARRRSVGSALSFAVLWLTAPILNRPRNSDIVHVISERAEAPH